MHKSECVSLLKSFNGGKLKLVWFAIFKSSVYDQSWWTPWFVISIDTLWRNLEIRLYCHNRVQFGDDLFPYSIRGAIWKPIESSLELQGGYFAYKTTGPACEALVFPFLSQCWWKKCCIAWIFHKNLAYQLPLRAEDSMSFLSKAMPKTSKDSTFGPQGMGKLMGLRP